jgi:hypothetical protein
MCLFDIFLSGIVFGRPFDSFYTAMVADPGISSRSGVRPTLAIFSALRDESTAVDRQLILGSSAIPLKNQTKKPDGRDSKIGIQNKAHEGGRKGCRRGSEAAAHPKAQQLGWLVAYAPEAGESSTDGENHRTLCPLAANTLSTGSLRRSPVRTIRIASSVKMKVSSLSPGSTISQYAIHQRSIRRLLSWLYITNCGLL